MKKSGNKNLIKIVAMTSLSVFTLFTSFTAAIAWFATSIVDNDGADNFKVRPDSGLLKKITIHTLSSQNDTNYVFNSTPKGTVTIGWEGNPNQTNLEGDTAIALGRYDPLDQSQPILLLFELNEVAPANSVEILAETETDGFIGRVTNADGNPLSSVIKSSRTTFLDSPISEGSTTFNVAKGAMSGESHFVNITYDDDGFAQIADSDGFVSEQQFYTSTDTSNIKYVGVIIDYYEPAMTYLFAVNIGNELFDMDASDPTKGVINFVCDWTMVI